MKVLHLHAKNACENVICEMAAILSRPQCVRPLLTEMNSFFQTGKIEPLSFQNIKYISLRNRT